MFNPLKAEVVGRFTAVESFFKAAHGLKGNEAQTARGLAFVQMYAAYEYTVTTVVQRAIDSLISHNHATNKLAPSLFALFLDPELTSLRDCPMKSEWERRLDLFKRVFDDAPAIVSNTVFPKDGTHFRSSQLQMIFRVLGINRTPAQRHRHLHRINEVVEARNAIAHGRETADGVGRRFTRAEVLHAIQQMKSVCLFLISAIQNYCSDPNKHCRK